MTRIGDLPCLWRAPANTPAPTPLRVGKYFPQAVRVAPHDLNAQLAVLTDFKSDWVTLIESDILPFSVLPLMETDPICAKAGIPYAYISRNSVTEEFTAEHGPAIWPRLKLIEQLQSGNRSSRPELILPVAMAHWYCNPTPEAAMQSGFASLLATLRNAPEKLLEKEIALRASVGADQKHGAAWIIGACHALLGSVSSDLALEVKSPVSDESLQKRSNVLARRVRLQTRFSVYALSASESRILKDTAFQMPPARHYLAAAKVFSKLDPQTADTYGKASAWLWGAQA